MGIPWKPFRDRVRCPDIFRLPSIHRLGGIFELDQFQVRRPAQEIIAFEVPLHHPDVEASIMLGFSTPASHPKLQRDDNFISLRDKLPVGHIDLDDVLRYPGNHSLPEHHPALSSMIERPNLAPASSTAWNDLLSEHEQISIAVGHPVVSESYALAIGQPKGQSSISCARCVVGFPAPS